MKTINLFKAILTLALFNFLTASQAFSQQPRCTMENADMQSKVKFCQYYIPSTRAGSDAAATNAAGANSIEIQVFAKKYNTVTNRLGHQIQVLDRHAPRFRVLVHKNNCNQIEGPNGHGLRMISNTTADRHAAVCELGIMNQVDFDYNMSHLRLDYNTTVNALLTGLGNQGLYTFMPNLVAFTASAIVSEGVLWSARKAFQNDQLISFFHMTARSIRKLRNTQQIIQAAPDTGAPATVTALRNEGMMARAGARLVSNAPGVFMMMLATSATYYPAYNAFKEMFNSTPLHEATKYISLLNRMYLDMNSCISAPTQCTRVAQAQLSLLEEDMNASENLETAQEFLANTMRNAQQEINTENALEPNYVADTQVQGGLEASVQREIQRRDLARRREVHTLEQFAGLAHEPIRTAPLTRENMERFQNALIAFFKPYNGSVRSNAGFYRPAADMDDPGRPEIH